MTGVVVEYADVILIKSNGDMGLRLVLGKSVGSVPIGVYGIMANSYVSDLLALVSHSKARGSSCDAFTPIYYLPYDHLPAPILAEILHDLRPENYKPIHGGKPAPDHGGTP